MAGTLVLIQKRNYDPNGLGRQQLGVGDKKKKYKGSLVTPLRPGLKCTLYRKAELLKQNQ